MKNKFNTTITTLIAGAVLLGAGALPVFAQINVGVGLTASTSLGASATVNASAGTKISQAVTKATTAITNRVTSLNALETRINAMQKVSASDKSTLSASIQTQITAMTTLQSQINADQTSNNTTSLKADIQSITKAYRIYILVIPQGTIAAASDRVLTITSSTATLAADLQSRITTDQNAGIDMSASVSALADLNAKSADATTQANAAVSVTASLQPDNGDTTIAQSNTAALKDARTKIQAAQTDLKAAREDALTIIQALKVAEKTTANVSTTNQ